MSAALAAACALLVAAAIRELWAERGERARERVRRRLRRLEPRFGTGGERRRRLLRRAGLERRLGPRALIGARIAAALASLPPAVHLAPVAPGRTTILALVALPLGASFLPDLALERRARARQRQIAASLPDALELMAVGAGSGRSGRALLLEAARGSEGPLREELTAAIAGLEAGLPRAEAMGGLGHGGGPELAALAVVLERSRRLGSPLTRSLQRQAVSLRVERARRIRDSAARAAPKIQLAVALLLVPSVLLIVAAAIVANADALFSGL